MSALNIGKEIAVPFLTVLLFQAAGVTWCAPNLWAPGATMAGGTVS